MLDIKRIRTVPKQVKSALEKRGVKGAVEKIIALDEQRRQIIVSVEALKNQRNTASKQIPHDKKEGKDVTALLDGLKQLSEQVKELDLKLAEVEAELNNAMLLVPNEPFAYVPLGKDDSDNVEIKKWGQPRKFNFEPCAHWDIGTRLNILDFETAAKLSGARFALYKGMGSRLERALVNFMLNLHSLKYTEVFTPFIVNRESMLGTGQLPKFEEDAFKLADSDCFLIPTAEVPVTNMYRDCVITKLPVYHCAYSACFRAEAGSAGRDTRGLIRLHQFNKVELVKFVKPKHSEQELLNLLADAESVLQHLQLPYRVVQLCTGDLGFASANTYDIEVWMPSYKRYVEISSCSNYRDFQSRRANIKYREAIGAKAGYVHTLNGSGLAVGRTVAAILENYQRGDGNVEVPLALQEALKCEVIGADLE